MAAPTSRFGRLRGLLHKLVDHGKALVAIFQQSPPPPDLICYVQPFQFGSTIPMILATIARGLHRIAALEARLLRIDAREQRRAVAANATPTSPPRERKPRSPAAQASRSAEAFKARLAGMTELEQIVAIDNRRPIGVVLAEISCDLGILRANRLWHDLSSEVIFNCGNLLRMWKDMNRAYETWPRDPDRPLPRWPGKDPRDEAAWYKALEAFCGPLPWRPI